MWDFADRLSQIEREGRLRRAVPIEPVDAKDPWLVRVQGKKARIFCSNDYLGLRTDPRVVEAAHLAARRYGGGSGAARQLAGDWPPLRELEAELAAHLGTQACLLFSSGYLANLGALPAFVGEGDLVFSDELNHASLIDGCRLSGAKIVVFRHGDARDLARKLRSQTGARRLLVTETLFSMDGDLAPFAQYEELKAGSDLAIYTDDAHALGTMEKLPGGADFRMGTLSKSLGSLGAFVAGSRYAVELLRNRARTHLFDTALSPAAAAGALEALRIVQAEPQRSQALRERALQLAQRLGANARFPSEATPILPLLLGAPESATECAAWLLERGFFVAAIRPPTVPAGTSRLRLTVSASHSPAQIDELAQALLDARKWFPWTIPQRPRSR